MGKKDTGLGEAVAAPSRLSPADIQQKEFRVSRFGGYKMRDVDEFLDQITDSFTALTSDVDRLRASGASPVVGSPDLGDVARQADEIIARARAEAARIVAEARTTAASTSAAAPNGPQDKAAVNAFIAREREFLQSLAGLVQEHAETVKGMAKSARSGPEAPAADASGPGSSRTAEQAQSGSTGTSPVAAAAAASTSPPAPSTPAAPSPGAPEATAEPTRVPESDDTVRIEEPATAGATRGDAEPEGDRSLRELFWGED